MDEAKALVTYAESILTEAKAAAARPRSIIRPAPVARWSRPSLPSRGGEWCRVSGQVSQLGIRLIRDGYQPQFAVDLAAVIEATGAVVTSTFRPGAVVACKGVPSMHSIQGGAIDLQGSDPELIAAAASAARLEGDRRVSRLFAGLFRSESAYRSR